MAEPFFVRRLSSFLLPLAACAFLALPAQAAEPLRIASLQPFSGYKEGAEMSRKGIELALQEINAAGGVLGRPLEVLFRDTHADPTQTLRAAEDLKSREHITLFTGTQFDHTGLAMNDFARKNKVFFFRENGTTPRFGWDMGNRYAWRGGDTNTYYWAQLLAEEAAKNPAKRWALFAPNYEYGRAGVAMFKEFLKKLRPDVEFVYEVFPETYKFNALQSLHAAESKKPEAYFTLLFGRDNVEFIRQGRKLGVLKDKAVVCGMCGSPAELETTGKETPEGWATFGYPAQEIDAPRHKAFVAAFEKAYGRSPYYEAYVSYQMPYVLKQMIERAGTTDTEKLIDANLGQEVELLINRQRFNPFTNELNGGTWIGKTGFKDGKPALVAWRFVDVNAMYPGDAFVQKLRDAASNQNQN